MGTKADVLRHPVPAGSYAISSSKNEIINAYLGTCVGVTLCDRKAGVGGLIHLLLPEPAFEGAPGKPENYAVTGMPLFLQALCEEGADMKRLEATVAGGALIGPVSEMDLNLDIGGRTLAIVEKTLDREQVPIQKSETGGFFSCQLGLDLKNWESFIEPITFPAATDEGDLLKPDQAQLESVIEGLRSIPQIVLKVIRMIRDDAYGMEDLAKEIRQDQVISARIIRMCSSAFFNHKMKIESIDRALVLLGEKQLLQLIVSAAFEGFFSNKRQGYSLCKGGLFNHALGTAMISEKLANLTGNVPADVAYTAGLLHDIGKVVLDQYMSKACSLFYRRTQVGGDNLCMVERETFGISHDEVGSRLAESWSLPEVLIDAIRYHHNPEEASIDSELTHLVYLADLLMSRFLVGQELERLETDSLVPRLHSLGFKADQFPVIIDNIPRRLFNIPFQ